MPIDQDKLKQAVDELRRELTLNHPLYIITLKSDLRLVLAALEDKDRHIDVSSEVLRQKCEALENDLSRTKRIYSARQSFQPSTQQPKGGDETNNDCEPSAEGVVNAMRALVKDSPSPMVGSPTPEETNGENVLPTIYGKPIQQFLHVQFPATEGNMFLNLWIKEVENIVATQRARLSLLEAVRQKAEAVIEALEERHSRTRDQHIHDQEMLSPLKTAIKESKL